MAFAESSGKLLSMSNMQAWMPSGLRSVFANWSACPAPGRTTWTMPLSQAGKTYQVVFYCGTSVVNKLVNNRD